MGIPKARKITSRIVAYANTKGRWDIPSFVYDQALEVAQKLIDSSDLYEQTEGHFLRSLAYFSNGEHIQAITSFENLFEYEVRTDVLSLYITVLIKQGYLQKASDIYDKYYISDEVIVPKDKLFASILLLNRMLLDIDKQNNYVRLYEKQDLPEGYIKAMLLNNEFIREDLANITMAGLDKALVQEVITIATKTSAKLGKFKTIFRTYIDKPNDDLHINIYVDDLDFQTMDDLNEGWLEAMVDHDSNYDFSDLSRVLVNFRPDPERVANVI